MSYSFSLQLIDYTRNTRLPCTKEERERERDFAGLLDLPQTGLDGAKMADHALDLLNAVDPG